MKFKSILFDLDGVLVMSEPVHYQAWVNTVDDLHKDFSIPEEEIIGITDRSVAVKIIDGTRVPFTEEELCRMKKDHFLQLLRHGIPIIEGRDEFLKEYSPVAGMAVVSSSSREEIGAILKAGGIDKYFRLYLGFEDTKLHKPEPEPYLKAMELLQIRPEDTLIIEDSPAGVEAATLSGAEVVGINSSGLLDHNQGIRIFKDYHGIMDWLQNNK